MSNVILYRVWLETETEGSMQRVYHDSWITQDAAERAVKRLNSALKLEGLAGRYVVEFSNWGKRKEVSRGRSLGNVCCGGGESVDRRAEIRANIHALERLMNEIGGGL